MKLTGKEMVSLYNEKDGERYFTISQLNLNQLLNFFILDRMCAQLEKNEPEKLVTGYLTINDLKISKGTKVFVKFQVSLKETIPGLENTKYDAVNPNLDISEFYNHVVELYDFYAYELDTVIDNIRVELIELEILKEDKYDENKKHISK